MPTPTHKSATSVTLAPLAEKSPFEQLVERLWKPALAAAVLVSGWLVYRQSQQAKALEQLDAEWGLLTAQAPLEGFPRIPTAAPGTFEGLAQRLQSSPAGPWARTLEANAHVKKRNYTAALASLEALKAQHRDHALTTAAWPFGVGSESTFVDAWTQSLQRRAAWENEHPLLFANPAPGEGAPRIKISTERGDIVVSLHQDQAPRHVESFLDRLQNEAWKGSKFFRIDPQLGVDVGDPDATGDPLPFEDTSLSHFAGAVTAAAGVSRKESSRHVFSILTEDRHDLDDQRVVFGQVEEGMDIVRQIAAADQNPDAPGQPAQAVSITSIERLTP